MCPKKSTPIQVVLYGLMVLIGSFLCFGGGVLSAHAQESGNLLTSKYYTVESVRFADGSALDRSIINGPPKPPPGFEVQRQAVSLPEPNIAEAVNVLTVPAFDWVFGCSAVSGAMISGYYDRGNYPDMYTGPTNGGIMPLDSSSWPIWSDVVGAVYPSCPLIASKDGVDGRVGRGSIDDYWVEYASIADDPYITGGWAQHAWGSAIGDYMKTSQSDYGNIDGATTFYGWTASAEQLTCSTMEQYPDVVRTDGTYGRKLFYEARGYTVTECYNQNTDNTIAGGFSFAQFIAEIDAGRPVLLNLAGHSIVGVGYDDATNLVYIHDTWDYNTHTMTWGGIYAGMELLSVSIVNLEPRSSSDAKLYATFPGYGLYEYDEANWTLLNTMIPTDMVVSGSDLYATFSGYGLFEWDGFGWSQLNSLTPASIVVSGTDLYATFSGYGLYHWNGSVWTLLNTMIPTSMVVSDSDLYVTFSGYGLYHWNGSVWTLLNTLIPDCIVGEEGSN